MSKNTKLDDATVRALVGARETDDYHPLLLDGTDAVIGAARVRALATEVLARREMTCGTCAFWYERDRGDGWCREWSDHKEADWHCADWQAKEEGR